MLENRNRKGKKQKKENSKKPYKIGFFEGGHAKMWKIKKMDF